MPTNTICRATFAVLFALSAQLARAEDAHVVFDVPDKIECRDVTPVKCAALHPLQKVIEVKFRVSAGLTKGSEESLVDFTYMISGPMLRMKILDYLPNTTLESRYADDRIEVADFSEESDTSSREARVAYTIFSLSAVKNQMSRKTEQNQYEKIAPKALVLASGTMNRGHGVFYKLRPSNSASLEGAKEFSFLAIVPRAWRGDWCTFVCSGRAEKKSVFGNSIVTVGVTKVDVGLHLCGDEQAGNLAARLCTLQQADNGALATLAAHEAERNSTTLSSPTSNVTLVGRVDDLFHQVTRTSHTQKPADKKLAAARQALAETEAELGRLSGAEP
ncbi:MAG: hypothetical protein K8U03_02860 [Planctomycetia bacterium]|nr:hypothetical protein [Planctomycetia bacterium]